MKSLIVLLWLVGVNSEITDPTQPAAHNTIIVEHSVEEEVGEFHSSTDNLNAEDRLGNRSLAEEMKEEIERSSSGAIRLSATRGPERVLGDTQWRRTRGFDTSAFDYYDDNTLREMADAGEPLAMYELATRLSSTSRAEKLHLLHESAILGLVSPLLQIPFFESDELLETSKDNEEAAAINRYAWTLVAQMRGDPKGLEEARKLRRREKYSEQVIAEACQQAQEIYQSLADERRQRGLPAFDNSPPPRVLSVENDLSSSGSECAAWPGRHDFRRSGSERL